MTDIAFQASPPRGVGMLRLVSPSAISRYGLPRIASRTGFSLASRAAAASVFILPTFWVAENDAALLGLGKRIPGAFRDHRALFLGQRRIDVQDEGVHVAAELSDDERDALVLSMR